MTWRKPNEGLLCSTRGKKEGNDGRMAYFVVVVVYNKGVILCKQYNGTLTGESFAEFARSYFPTTFERTKNFHGKLFLQDGDPRQVSRCAKNAMDDVGCRMFAISARSPDLNPTENMFHLVRANLQKDSLTKEIKKEMFLEFSSRVRKTNKSSPVEILNKTFDSMPKRLAKIVSAKGERTKY